MSKKSDCGNNILPSCLNLSPPLIHCDIRRSRVVSQSVFLHESNIYNLIAGYFNMLQAQEKQLGLFPLKMRKKGGKNTGGEAKGHEGDGNLLLVVQPISDKEKGMAPMP